MSILGGDNKIKYFVYEGKDIFKDPDSNSVIGSRIGTVFAKGKEKQAVIFFRTSKPDFYQSSEHKLKEYGKQTKSTEAHLKLFLRGRKLTENNIDKLLTNIKKVGLGPKEIIKLNESETMEIQRPFSLNEIDIEGFEHLSSKLHINMRESPSLSGSIKSNSWFNKKTKKIEKSQNLLEKITKSAVKKSEDKGLLRPKVAHKKGDTLEMAALREKMLLFRSFQDDDRDAEHDPDAGLTGSSESYSDEDVGVPGKTDRKSE